jgi:hypothetical protein
MKPVSRQCTIISQTRPKGNMTSFHSLVDEIPDINDIELSTFSIHVLGDNVQNWTTMKQLRIDMVVVHDKANRTGIISDKEINHDQSLCQLVWSKGLRPLVSDPLQFHLWIEAMLPSAMMPPSHPILGMFCYACCDYWNYKETWGLEVAHGSIHILKVCSSRPGQLLICQDGSCFKSKFYWVYAIIQMVIRWEGYLEGNIITWNQSLWIKGWSFLSKMIDCPPLSEKLRQDPWII